MIAMASPQVMRCRKLYVCMLVSSVVFQLLQEIKKVNITVDNTTQISFDQNGDPRVGQEILEWKMDNLKVNITSIGECETSGNIRMYCNISTNNTPVQYVSYRKIVIYRILVLHYVMAKYNSTLG